MPNIETSRFGNSRFGLSGLGLLDIKNLGFGMPNIENSRSSLPNMTVQDLKIEDFEI